MAKLRKIRKWGNSWVVLLAQTDALDNNIIQKGWLDIEDAIFYSEDPRTIEQEMADKNLSKIAQVKNAN